MLERAHLRHLQGSASSTAVPVVGARTGMLTQDDGVSTARPHPAPALAELPDRRDLTGKTVTSSPPPPPSTPIEVPMLRRLVTPEVLQPLLLPILQQLEYGADIGYTGPALSSSAPNTTSVRSRLDAVSAAIRAEVERGHTVDQSEHPPPHMTPLRWQPPGRSQVAPSTCFSTSHSRTVRVSMRKSTTPTATHRPHAGRSPYLSTRNAKFRPGVPTGPKIQARSGFCGAVN